MGGWVGGLVGGWVGWLVGWLGWLVGSQPFLGFVVCALKNAKIKRYIYLHFCCFFDKFLACHIFHLEKEQSFTLEIYKHNIILHFLE